MNFIANSSAVSSESPDPARPFPPARSEGEPDCMTRRKFVGASALAAAGALAGCQSVPGSAGGNAIDAHVHVWTPDLGRYPIHSSFQPSDLQPASFTPEELFAHTRPNGVRRVVLIQMSFYRFDNRYLLDSMRRFPGVFSGVGIVDETAPRPRDRVRELVAQGVRGFRIHPGPQSIDAWMDSSGMADLWQAGAELGAAMCPLIGPEALPAIDRMCARFPQTRVVIDHLARIGVDGVIRQEHVDALCRLARHRRVHVKTSAFYALGRKRPPYDDLGPMIRQVRDAYGAQRLMWASDCPYQVDAGHSYADSIALIRDRLGFLSPSDREWMLRRTAEKVFFS